MKRRYVGTMGTLIGSLTLTGLALAAAIALPPPGLAAADTKGAAATLSAGDKDFIMEAACGGMAEVALGELAQQKGQSDAVKQFGKHMVEDHSKANNELKELAGRKGVVVPAALKPKYQKLVDSLSKLSGTEFDKQYMREMVKDHENDVAAFQKEADKGKDSELTSWVRQTLPTLQDHLKMARDAETRVKGG
jgi:putative membrane protein